VSRTPVFALCFTLVGAAAAHAQIIDSRIGRTRDPIAWTSLSIGWFRQNALCDQETNACWDFGSAPQWRATLEFPMGRGATVGAAATIARVPMVYNGGIGANSCVRCDADANIVQYLANVRIGGGSGFHQVIDLNAGTTVFSNFRSTTGTRLGGKAVTDWSFSVGYGFAYSLSPRMQIMLLQEYGLVIHARQSGSAERTAQQSTIRLGGRVGLGDR
jgi:hypothetical protein